MVIPIVPILYVRDRGNNRMKEHQNRQDYNIQAGYNSSAPVGMHAIPTPQNPPPYHPYGNSYDNIAAQLPQNQQQPFEPPSGCHPNASQSRVCPSASIPAWQQAQRYNEYTRPAAGNDCAIARSMNQGAAFCDRIAARLNEAVSRIDGDDGRDDSLEPYLQQFSWEEGEDKAREPQVRAKVALRGKGQDAPGSSLSSCGKCWLYANSRLPPHLPPLHVYMPTWRLLCMAARVSQDVYQRPRGSEKEDYIDADWRQGTKAMVLKSSPIDDQNLIVFAIRGSQWNAIDWLVNLRPAPTAPTGFLDDSGNACHAGFLSVARSMIAPVAARLRQLLEQEPSRASSSLLITGHSAGGAVAALLYMHMLSTTNESELNILTGCFKRVHCVTFGAPPVSFLPLQKPTGKKFEKSVFLSFINEGDLVARFADKAYITSLAKLLAAPAPKLPTPKPTSPSPQTLQPSQKPSSKSLVTKMSKQKLKSSSVAPPLPSRPGTALAKWPVPPATLSNAGRLVLLRQKPRKQQRQNQQHQPRQVPEAVCTSDQQLREVIFGDIAAHAMSLYKQRIDDLAIAAVTGQ